MSSEILCVGELLWDSLPSGLFLGGAPFNVAGHLHALGLPVCMASRVGDDRLGAEATRRLAASGIATDLVQVDASLPTGFVSVTVDGQGVPSYDIVQPAAWDAIAFDDALRARASGARAIVFGSLAQRSPITRATIACLFDVDVPKVFDVNLRAPYDDKGVVTRSLAHADIVKLNDVELEQIAHWLGLPHGVRDGATALADRFACETICVTRGSEGAAMLRAGRWTEHAGFRVEVKDTVGSGDAFLASLLAGIVAGVDDAALLQRANLLGAYVATQQGALPTYDANSVIALPAHSHEREA